MTSYATALHTGKVDAAHALLSNRCQAVIPKSEFAGVVKRATDRFGGATPTVSGVKATLIDDRAFVSYTVTAGSTSFSPSDVPWVREGGQWRMDGCN